jgi:hypothetical protein
MQERIIIWDNDGTILGSKNPDDTSAASKVILPGVAYLMNQENSVNIICSGSRTELSERHNFDVEKMVEKFTTLMEQLPITAAVFAPTIGGTECWVVIKDSCCGGVEVRKAHEDPRYAEYIGKFKKPDVGMFAVIRDLLAEFDLPMTEANTIVIGDAWQDQTAAQNASLPFIPAQYIHGTMPEKEARDYIEGKKKLN